MTKIILTTNFSESARNAMIYAIHLFGTTDTEFVLMNTFIDASTGTDGFISAEELTKRGGTADVQAEKALLKKHFEGVDIKLKCVSVHGQLVSAINDTVTEESADYVVLGNKNKYDIDASFLRTKSYELIGKIKCPVLAVPQNREFKMGQGGLIFATDLNVIQKPEQLKPVIGIAQRYKVPVLGINVRRANQAKTEKEEKASQQLNKIFESVNFEMHQIEDEQVMRGITDFVATKGSSLLILLARKHNILQGLVQQRLTKEISKVATLPLLILHDY